MRVRPKVQVVTETGGHGDNDNQCVISTCSTPEEGFDFKVTSKRPLRSWVIR